MFMCVKGIYSWVFFLPKTLLKDYSQENSLSCKPHHWPFTTNLTKVKSIHFHESHWKTPTPHTHRHTHFTAHKTTRLNDWYICMIISHVTDRLPKQQLLNSSYIIKSMTFQQKKKRRSFWMPYLKVYQCQLFLSFPREDIIIMHTEVAIATFNQYSHTISDLNWQFVFLFLLSASLCLIFFWKVRFQSGLQVVWKNSSTWWYLLFT